MNNLRTYEEFNWKKGAAGVALIGALSGGMSSCVGDDVDYIKSIDININKENIELNRLLDVNNIELPCVIELSNINCGLCRKYYVELKKVSRNYKDINFYYILTGPTVNMHYDSSNRKIFVFTDNKIFNLNDLFGVNAPLHSDSSVNDKNISTSDNIGKLRKNIMEKYGIDAFPATIIIDKNKNVHILKYGYMTQSRLERYVKQYIPKEIK